MCEVKKLLELINSLPKQHMTENFILSFIVDNADEYGVVVSIYINQENNEVNYVINNYIKYYDYINSNTELKNERYTFYLKKDEVELINYLLKRFY